MRERERGDWSNGKRGEKGAERVLESSGRLSRRKEKPKQRVTEQNRSGRARQKGFSAERLQKRKVTEPSSAFNTWGDHLSFRTSGMVFTFIATSCLF